MNQFRSARGARRGLVLALGLWLVSTGIGCTQLLPPPPSAQQSTYVVGPPDVLEVNILPDPAVQRTAVVRPDGMISIDLVGDVQASGRTVSQIANDIEQRISRFKRDARVTVAVGAARSQQVTIFGEVGGQGTFPLITDTRVTEAIGTVGGLRPFAAKNRIRIVRTNGEATDIFKVRLGDIEDGDLSTNYMVRGGDLIIVPPTYLASIGYLIQQLLFPFSQFLSAAAGAGSAVAVSGGI